MCFPRKFPRIKHRIVIIKVTVVSITMDNQATPAANPMPALFIVNEIAKKIED